MGDRDFDPAERLARDSGLRHEVHESGKYVWIGGDFVRRTGPSYSAEDIARNSVLRDKSFVETDDSRLMEYKGPKFTDEQIAQDSVLRKQAGNGKLKKVGKYWVKI